MVARPALLSCRPRRAFVAALLLLASLGCGERDGGADPGEPREPWPLTVDAPALLGYVAFLAEPDDLAGLWEAAISWRPAGLRAGEPVVFAWLDAAVLGGPAAIVLPVADRDAFRASLRAAPTVVDQGDDHYRLELPPDHVLVQRARLAARMLSAGSAFDMLDALGEERAASQPAILRFVGEHALLVPSPESVGILRRVLADLPGLTDPADASFVASIDVERCKTVFQEQIAGGLAKLRALLLGARAAGLAQIVAGMADHDRPRGPGLPMSGEAIWALVEMLGLEQVEALQVRLDGFGTEFAAWNLRALMSELTGDDSLAGHASPSLRALTRRLTGDDSVASEVAPPAPSFPDGRVVLRLRSAGGAPLDTLTSCLTGTPAEDDLVTLAFDSQRLPAAAAAWLRPLAEVAHGKGPPCDRSLAELEALLAPLSGRSVLRVTEPPLLALGVAPGMRLDRDGLDRWFTTLADAVGWKGWDWARDGTSDVSGDPGAGEIDAEGREISDEPAEGDPQDADARAASAWQIVELGELLLVLPPGADGDAAAESIAPALARPAAPGEPGLRVRVAGFWLDVSARDGELVLETRLDGLGQGER